MGNRGNMDGGYRHGQRQAYFARSIAHAIVCHEFCKPARKARLAAEIEAARKDAYSAGERVPEAEVARYVTMLRAERLKMERAREAEENEE